MGSLNIIGLTSSKFSIGFLSAQIAPIGGIILFLLIIIAGFLIFKYKIPINSSIIPLDLTVRMIIEIK